MGDILACNTPIRCTKSITITTWHVFGVWHLLGIDEKYIYIERKEILIRNELTSFVFKYPISVGKFGKGDKILKYGFETWIFLTFMKRSHMCFLSCMLI